MTRESFYIKYYLYVLYRGVVTDVFGVGWVGVHISCFYCNTYYGLFCLVPYFLPVPSSWHAGW